MYVRIACLILLLLSGRMLQAAVIVRLLKCLQADAPSLRIAVITFYAAQRALLGRELTRGGVGAPVEVHTVDSYQVASSPFIT